MKTKPRKQTRNMVADNRPDYSWHITPEDVREFIASNTRTHADTMKFLHRVGLRIRKDGSTYVVPI